MGSPRYQPSNKKRYACATCNRRLKTWADIHRHSTGMHGSAPTLLQCDLVLRAERKRMATAGVPEEDLPVSMPGLKAVSDCGQEAQG